MKIKRGRYIKKILRPTFSVGTILFLLIQVVAGTLAPVSFDGKDFWKSGFQKAEAAMFTVPQFNLDIGVKT